MSVRDRECHRLTSSPLTLHCLRAETRQFHQNPSFSVTLRHIYSCCYTLNKLGASTNGNYVIYRNPRALSSVLATLGTLQPQALGFLNRVVPLVSASTMVGGCGWEFSMSLSYMHVTLFLQHMHDARIT